MSNTPQSAAPSNPLLRALVANRQLFRLGLFLLAGICLLIPIIFAIREGTEAGIRPWWLYLAAVGICCAFVAMLNLTGEDTDESAREGRLRLELMVLGGTVGLLTALLGFLLPFLTYREQLAAGLESWREHPQALIYPGIAVLGGLALMLVSVQLVRGMERQNQTLRRLVYGYNVVLTTILLLAVLALPNILAYAQPFARYFSKPYDWTASKIHSLSPLMRNFVAELKVPVRVTIMMDPDAPVSQDTRTMLDLCKGVNSLFTYTLLSPYVTENAARIRELQSKYNIADPDGILVEVGEEKDQVRPDFVFIRSSDLFDARGMRGRADNRGYVYKGENALFNAVSSLIHSKMVIYFTTGHGEMTSETDFTNAMGGRDTESLSKLRERLTERKSVEVKTLNLDLSTKKIPDDASVVVIARPTDSFRPEIVNVLREYLQRAPRIEKVKTEDGKERDEEKVTSGKLMLLLPPVVQKGPDGSSIFKPTGLELLLTEYGIKLNNERLLSLNSNNPVEITTQPDPRSQNPIAKSFLEDVEAFTPIFLFQNVRNLEVLDSKAPSKTVQTILLAPARQGLILDNQPSIDPIDRLRALFKDQSRLAKELLQRNPPVAIGVSEGSLPPGMPTDAAHAGLSKTTPKMVVVGSASWVSDERMRQGFDRNFYLFNSCVNWLRETTIGEMIEAKERKIYELGIPPQDAGRVQYLPLGLMLLAVIGLGTGVWVVRRR